MKTAILILSRSRPFVDRRGQQQQQKRRQNLFEKKVSQIVVKALFMEEAKTQTKTFA